MTYDDFLIELERIVKKPVLSEKTSGYITFNVSSDGSYSPICSVSFKYKYVFNLFYIEFISLPDEERKEIASLLTELSGTNCNERYSDEAFFLQVDNSVLPILQEEEASYLRRDINGNYSIGDRSKNHYFQMIFSEKELEKIDETGFKRISKKRAEEKLWIRKKQN